VVAVSLGPPIDLSQWQGRADDQEALLEATAKIISTITAMLAEIRQEQPPATPFDWRTSTLPRTGNFKKEIK